MQRGANGSYNALVDVDESAIGGPGRGGRIGTGRLSWYSEQALKVEEEARKYQAMQDAEEAIRKKVKKREDIAPKRVSTWKNIASSISRSATRLSRSATRKERGSMASGLMLEKQYDPEVGHDMDATTRSSNPVPPLPPLPPLPSLPAATQSSYENSSNTESATVTTNNTLSSTTPYITAPPPISQKYKSLPYKLTTNPTNYQSIPDSDFEEFTAHQPLAGFPHDSPPKSPLQRLGTWGKSKLQQLRGEPSNDLLPDAQYTMSRRDDDDTAVLVMVPKGTVLGVDGSGNRVILRMDVDVEEAHAGNGTGSLIEGASGLDMGAKESEEGKGEKVNRVNREQLEVSMPVPESPLQVTMGFRLDGPGELPNFAYY